MKNANPKQLAETSERLFEQFSPNPDSDHKFFQEIINDFADSLDLMTQLKQFHAWCVDQHPKKIKNCRFRFRSWLVNAKNYQQSRPINGTPHPIRPK